MARQPVLSTSLALRMAAPGTIRGFRFLAMDRAIHAAEAVSCFTAGAGGGNCGSNASKPLRAG